MTVSRDLFLAILSMDSYHRGYQQGVNGIPVSFEKTRIGKATI